MNKLPTPESIVVGIDGSKAAVRAALWAIDEAVSRDIPLRLLYAIEPDDTASVRPEAAARRLAIAENAVRYAFMAVEAADERGQDRGRDHPGAGDHIVDPCFGVGRHVVYRRGRRAPLSARAGRLHRCGPCVIGTLPGGHHPGPGRSGRTSYTVDCRRRRGVCRQRRLAGDRGRGSTTMQLTATGDHLSANRGPRYRQRNRGRRSPDTCQPGSSACPLDATLSGRPGGVLGGARRRSGLPGRKRPIGTAARCQRSRS